MNGGRAEMKGGTEGRMEGGAEGGMDRWTQSFSSKPLSMAGR